MRSIYSGINRIELFGVLDKNRERESVFEIFFWVSLSSSSFLSLISRSFLSLLSPSPNFPFPDRSCVRRSTSGQAPTSTTFTSCRISLEHRRAASNGHAHCRDLRVCHCSGHATASSSSLLLQSRSWSSKEGRSTSEGLQNSCTKAATLNPHHRLRAPPSLHGGASNHLGWVH